jgi:hypothetical protein
LGKNLYNFLNIGPNFFLQHFKTKINFNFVKFVATWKGMTTNFFSLLSSVAAFGSGMGKNQDSGSGIRDKHAGSATLPSPILLDSVLSFQQKKKMK